MINRFYLLFLMLAVFLMVGCQTAEMPQEAAGTSLDGEPFVPTVAYVREGLLFDDVSVPAGIVYKRYGSEKLIGQAWGDVDGDGWLDLYTTDHEGPNRLYHNNGDGTFALSVLAEQVALPQAESSGAVFADYDNDGDADLLVLNWGRNVLFANTAEGFVDVTAEAGLADDEAQSKTASWGDYDGDGDLDLYIANWSCYPRCGRPQQGELDRLYRNGGDGTFTDVTVATLTGGRTRGAGFVASFVDYDNDGDADIYLVNDEFINPVGNALWRNDGPGCEGWCFTDVAAEVGANTKVMGMGLATADYDNDGDIDLYFSNAGPMAFLQNQGDGTFVDVSAETGTDLGSEFIGWGTVFFDYDNDGWQDLYMAISDLLPSDDPADAFMRNDGAGSFEHVPPRVSGLDRDGRTLGVAYADYDNDGWLDLVVGNYDGRYVLYHNSGQMEENGRIAVKLVGDGVQVNRDGVGARVMLVLSDGRVQMQEVVAGSSLGAGNTLQLHFGLGEAEIEEMIVRWPDGTEQSFTNVTLNQRYTLVYPFVTEN